MLTFEGISDAADGIRDWLIGNKASLGEHEARLIPLTKTGSSPVVLLADFVETVYANPDSFPAEAKEIAAAAARVGEENGYHGMNEEARGSKIAKVLTGQKVAAPPEPKAEYVPAPTEEPAADPVAAPPAEG